MAGIRIKRGRTRKWTYIVSDSSGVRDITDDHLWFTVKSKVSDADNEALFQLAIGSGILLTDPTAGTFVVTVAPNLTWDCPSKRSTYVYDLKIEYDTGEIYTLDEGSFVVEPDVTNTTYSGT